MDLRGVERSDEAEAASELHLAGIPQQLPAGAEHDRQLLSVDVEAFEQHARVGVGVRVELMVRMSAPAEEVLEPQHVAVIGAADDDRPGPGLDQTDAAEDQRAHDLLAEFRLRHQQRAELLRRNDERLDRSLGVGVDQGRAAGELGHLAHERAGAVGDDRVATIELVAPSDGDLAREDDGQPVTDLADLHEGLARAIRPELPEPAQPVDLRRLEGREHLLPAGFDQRAFRRRHRGSRRYAGADEVVNLDRGSSGASKANGAHSLSAAGSP